MINTNRFLLGLVLGTAALVPLATLQPAQAQSAAFKAEGRRSIVDAYTRIDQAVLTNNPAIFEAKLAPDFIGYADNGQAFNRTQALARIYTSMGGNTPGFSMKIIKSKSKILSLTWRGSDAVVMVQGTQVATVRVNGQKTRLEAVIVAREFWSRFKVGWLARQSVVTQASVWIDGKKFK